MGASPDEDLKRRRGLAWAVFWRLETIWCSTTLSTTTKLRLLNSLIVSLDTYYTQITHSMPYMNQDLARTTSH